MMPVEQAKGATDVNGYGFRMIVVVVGEVTDW